MSPTSWRIDPRILWLSLLGSVILLVPLAIAFLLGGPAAAIAIGMGYLALARPALSLSPIQALGLAVPAAMVGAVAVGLRGQPLAAACFVALCCLLVAPANQVQDSLMAGLPSLAAVLVALPGSFDPGWTAALILVGAATLVLVATRVPGRRRSAGIEPKRAWRHAIVMAASVAAVVFTVEYFSIPHGYWAALTLTIVLRPFDDQTWRKAGQRILGTLAGVVLAVLLATLLPLWAIGIGLGGCLVLTIAYSAQGDYLRQVLFLTPAVVLLGTTASVGVMAAERALATVAGALIAGLIAILLAKYDEHRRVVEESV